MRKVPVPIRVTLVSPRPLIRGALLAWMLAQPNLELHGEASELNRVRSLSETDILIVDARNSSAFAAIELLREAHPRLPALCIVASRGDYMLRRSSSLVQGLVHEFDGMETLSAAISAVAGGGLYHSAGVMQQGALPLRALTTRELSVLELACAGMSDDEMGERLSCASATAEKHRQNLMRKLGARDRTELIILGIRMGIVAVEDLKIGEVLRRSSSRRQRQ